MIFKGIELKSFSFLGFRTIQIMKLEPYYWATTNICHQGSDSYTVMISQVMYFLAAVTTITYIKDQA